MPINELTMDTSPARSHWYGLLILVLVAIAARGIHSMGRPMISKDGVYYVQLIENFNRKQAAEAHAQPLYLLTSWGLKRITGFSAQTSAHVVSYAFAAGSLVVLYFLSLSVGGRPIAWFATLLYSVHPLTVTMDADVSNFSIALFWTLLTLWATWRGLRHGSLLGIVVTPVLFALAMLSRREAFALVPVIILAPVIAFFMSALPRFRYLVEPTLKCILVSGAVNAVFLILAFNTIPLGQSRFIDMSSKVSYWLAYTTDMVEGPNMEAVGHFFTDGIKAVYVTLIPLILIGVCAGRPKFCEPGFFYFSLLFVLGSLVILIGRGLAAGTTYISSRYYLMIVPLLCMFAASGLLQIRDWVGAFGKRWGFAAILAMVILPCIYQGTFAPTYRSEAPYREAAEYIRSNYGTGKNVASTRSQIAYYAAGNHVQLPTEPESLKLDSVEFLVLRVSSNDNSIAYDVALVRTGKAVLLRTFGKDIWLLQVNPPH